MGILKFQSWLRFRFRQQYSREISDLLQNESVERLFIDANAIVHNAINDVYSTEDEVEYQNMFSMSAGYWNEVADTFLDEIFTIVDIARPTIMLYIAFDGPVMKAKLLQQRQRSYRSSADPQPFDRNQVKPGTDFMATICDRIRAGIKAWMKEGKELGEFRPAEAYLSDTYDAGEGEHKIMSKMREEARNRTADVLYSPDSDMHLLTYLHCRTRNVIIMRKPHAADEKGPYEFFHATQVKRLILGAKVRSGPKSKTAGEKKKSQTTGLGFGCIEDFIIVSCFGGNDFLPALPFAKFGDGNAFDAITKAYRKAFPNTVDNPKLYINSKINWHNLYKYLVHLQIQSEQFLHKAAMDQLENIEKYFNKETNEDRRSKVLEWALTEKKGVYKFNQAFFNERYKRYIFGTFHKDDMMREEFINFDSTKEQVRNYLEGLVWVMSYYQSQGSSVNKDWAYVFHYPPDTEDLVLFLKENHSKPYWVVLPLNHSNQQENTPLEHLLVILRKDQLWLLPPVVRTLFLEAMPELFPENVVIDKTSIPFGDEGHDIVLINYPSMSRIRNLFDTIRENPTVKRINNVRKKPTQIWPARGGKTK